jgi:hypothetical protein
MGPTYPHRIYQHAAVTDRLDDSLALSTLPTIWDRLSDAGLSGRYYHSDRSFLELCGAASSSTSPPPRRPTWTRPSRSAASGCRPHRLAVLGARRHRPGDLRPRLDPEDDRVALGPARLSSATRRRTTSPTRLTSTACTGACRTTPCRRSPRPPARRAEGGTPRSHFGIAYQGRPVLGAPPARRAGRGGTGRVLGSRAVSPRGGPPGIRLPPRAEATVAPSRWKVRQDGQGRLSRSGSSMMKV